MISRVSSKRQMYDLLASGLLGNTIPQYFSVESWRASGDDRKYGTWGVRTQQAGGPCRLQCPVDEVEATAAGFEAAGNRINISCMDDAFATCTLWADVWDSPTGIIVYGIEWPKISEGWTWRNSMPTRGRHWQGLAATMLLRRHLNPNSYDDIAEIFARWPGHVLELTALDRSFGTIPHRNGIHWELRNY